jgi:hypothetical protein
MEDPTHIIKISQPLGAIGDSSGLTYERPGSSYTDKPALGGYALEFLYHSTKSSAYSKDFPMLKT